MKISALSIDEIASMLRDRKKGSELIKLFNKFGYRDVYDEQGLPDIGKKNGQRPSKIQYASKRLSELNGKSELRCLIEDIVNNDNDIVPDINKIIKMMGLYAKSMKINGLLRGE